MLADFVNRLVELCRQANQPGFLDHSQVPNSTFHEKPDGSLERIDFPAPMRGHTLSGYEDVIRIASDPGIAPAPEIFHDHQAVTVCLNSNERTEFATCRLRPTDSMRNLVRNFSEPLALKPQEAVRYLRFNLPHASTSAVIRTLSNLNFERRSGGHVSVEHGQESLGRSVETEVQQRDTIPETFVAEVYPYANPGFDVFGRISIEVGIHLNLEEERVEFQLLADSLEQQIGEVQLRIGAGIARDLEERRTEAGVPPIPVFHGSFS